MRAVIYAGAGGTEVITLGDVPNPEVKPGHIRVRVHAAGLNRADLIQRKGNYPAPKGWPADIPGQTQTARAGQPSPRSASAPAPVARSGHTGRPARLGHR